MSNYRAKITKFLHKKYNDIIETDDEVIIYTDNNFNDVYSYLKSSLQKFVQDTELSVILQFYRGYNCMCIDVGSKIKLMFIYIPADIIDNHIMFKLSYLFASMARNSLFYQDMFKITLTDEMEDFLRTAQLMERGISFNSDTAGLSRIDMPLCKDIVYSGNIGILTYLQLLYNRTGNRMDNLIKFSENKVNIATVFPFSSINPDDEEDISCGIYGMLPPFFTKDLKKTTEIVYVPQMYCDSILTKEVSIPLDGYGNRKLRIAHPSFLIAEMLLFCSMAQTDARIKILFQILHLIAQAKDADDTDIFGDPTFPQLGKDIQIEEKTTELLTVNILPNIDNIKKFSGEAKKSSVLLQEIKNII